MKGKGIIALITVLVLLVGCLPVFAPAEAEEAAPVSFAEFAQQYAYQDDPAKNSYLMKSSDGAITIDFASETIYWSGNVPSEDRIPRYISLDGGRRWRPMRFTIPENAQRSLYAGNFSKMLNKEMDLRLASALDPRTRQPQTMLAGTAETPAVQAAAVYTFGSIMARPRMDRFRVEYLTDCDYWVLVNDRGEQTMLDLQVAYSQDGRKPAGNPDVPGDARYGLFKQQNTVRGNITAVPVLQGPDRAGQRLSYLVRIKPTANSAGSKPKRLGIQSFTRRPKLRIDYGENIIKVKPGIQAVTSGTLVLPADSESAPYGDTGAAITNTSTGYSRPYERGSAEVADGFRVQNGKSYGFRFAATGRKPASVVQVVSVSGSGDIFETDATPSFKGNSLKIGKDYEMYNAEKQKWVRSLRIESNQKVQVRRRDTARYNPSNNVTTGGLGSEPILLDVAVQRDIKNRVNIVKANYILDDNDKTASAADKAAYIPASDSFYAVTPRPGTAPDKIELVFDLKGSGDFVWSITGLDGQDAFTASHADGAKAYVYSSKTVLTLTGLQNDTYNKGTLTITLKDGDDPADEKFYCPVVTIQIQG